MSPEKPIFETTDDRQLMEKDLAEMFQNKENSKLEMEEVLNREVNTKRVNKKNRQFRKE
jgi:hypothetical protein